MIKFDCWHTLDLPLIRRAFPGVPWIFVYRDPVEVMVSHERLPGSQMLPGLIDPRVFGFDPATIFQMPRMEYGARVLATICAAAVEHAQRDSGLIVNYRQLPQAAWEVLLSYFRIDHTPADIEHIGRVAQFDAKRPQAHFAADAEAKQAEASADIRELVERWIQPVYAALTALDRQQAE